MNRHGTPRKYLIAARSASLAIGALALANEPRWAKAYCWEWNTRFFFESAGVADVTRCLDNGMSLNQHDRSGLTPLHHAALHSGPAQVRALLHRGAGLFELDVDGRTPLHLAAEKQGAPENVTILVNAGAKVDARDESGRTPLHAAARKGTLASVKALLNAGTALDSRDHRGATPLHAAGGHDAPANIIELLRAGADLGARDESGRTALHMAAWGRTSGNIKVLLHAGARVDPRDELYSQTPLHVAAHLATPAGIAILLEAGAEASAKDNLGRTPMHYAAKYRPENITALARAGADPNARDVSGRSPLHEAARTGNPGTIAALVVAGAEVDSRDSHGWTPLRQAAKWSKAENRNALLKAGADPATFNEGEAKQAPGDRIRAELKSRPAAPPEPVPADCSRWNQDSFFLHATPGDVARCIERGGGLSEGPRGRTPLHAAASAGRPEHVAALLDAGAEASARDQSGRTPLHCAVANAAGSAFDRGRDAIGADIRLGNANLTLSGIAVLLDAGVDVDARDEHGRAPLHAAARRGWPEYIGALVDAGADIGA